MVHKFRADINAYGAPRIVAQSSALTAACAREYTRKVLKIDGNGLDME